MSRYQTRQNQLGGKKGRLWLLDPILAQVRYKYLIVSIPDLYTLTYFELTVFKVYNLCGI